MRFRVALLFQFLIGALSRIQDKRQQPLQKTSPGGLGQRNQPV